MWRKIIVAVVVLISTFSIAYGYYNWNMSANTKSGGIVTGRVGAVGNSVFSKGDRIITDISYDGTPIEWLLLNDSSKWIKKC